MPLQVNDDVTDAGSEDYVITFYCDDEGRPLLSSEVRPPVAPPAYVAPPPPLVDAAAPAEGTTSETGKTQSTAKLVGIIVGSVTTGAAGEKGHLIWFA